MFDHWHPSFWLAVDNLYSFVPECKAKKNSAQRILMWKQTHKLSEGFPLFKLIGWFSLLRKTLPYLFCLISSPKPFINLFWVAELNSLPLFLCVFVLSTGGPPRPRHSHSSLLGALWEHPHDHLAGYCLCLQGAANGERTSNLIMYSQFGPTVMKK